MLRETASKTIAAVIEKTDELLEIVKPDTGLIYGDTNSCLSVISKKKDPNFSYGSWE